CSKNWKEPKPRSCVCTTWKARATKRSARTRACRKTASAPRSPEPAIKCAAPRTKPPPDAQRRLSFLLSTLSSLLYPLLQVHRPVGVRQKRLPAFVLGVAEFQRQQGALLGARGGANQ